MSLIAHTVGASAWVMALSERTCGSRVKLSWQRQGCSSVWWEGWVVGHLKRTMTKSGTEQPLPWCGFKRTKFSQQISQNTSQAMQEKCQSCSSVESLGFLQRVTCLLLLQLPPGHCCPEESLSKGSHGWGVEAESTCSPCLLTTRDIHLGMWLPWIKTALCGWDVGAAKSPWIMHVLESSTMIIFLWCITHWQPNLILTVAAAIRERPLRTGASLLTSAWKLW